MQQKFENVRKEEVPSPTKTRAAGEGCTTYRRMGPQLPPIRTNTPLKSWKEVFHGPVRSIVVKHTNAYGKRFTKDWDEDLDNREFLDFIAVLFMAAVQKRRDGPKQWFSSDPILGNPCIKRLMNLRRFLQILQSLSICSLINPRGMK